jgi:hypothetical protein
VKQHSDILSTQMVKKDEYISVGEEKITSSGSPLAPGTSRRIYEE